MARMATNIINEDETFNCEALSIFTCKHNTTLGAKDVRKYFQTHWRRIFQNMKNSTILFIAGVHGTDDGKLGDPVGNLTSLKNQVGSQTKFSVLNFYGFFNVYFSSRLTF